MKVLKKSTIFSILRTPLPHPLLHFLSLTPHSPSLTPSLLDSMDAPLSPPCHPSISPSLSDMGRVGYPDKARLYKHSSTTGRTPSPERGISPQSSHTNAYILTRTRKSDTHSQASNITQVALFSIYNAFIQPRKCCLRSTMESVVDETRHLSFQTAGSGALII